jgi:hypothetical protein
MKFKSFIKLISSSSWALLFITCASCSNDNQHAFLFGCIRPEQITREISVSGLTSGNKNKIENELRLVDGFASCIISEEKNCIRVVYNSSAARYMNIERILQNNDITILK